MGGNDFLKCLLVQFSSSQHRWERQVLGFTRVTVPHVFLVASRK